MFEILMYRQSLEANLSFLKHVPKEKEFFQERLFYIRNAANAKRSLIQLNKKAKDNG
ncbi:hypothetical protein XSR1_100101 [Xenorhabdus szentirmaii DSM 16338]|uniref:Uncharacterized protein n=1 Tax=Xenorhabdus szentirmaii DSM 16338 TaxID=1427518 RepID=W1ITW4_9GAMM|nr:hypothetical protein XSR1_100101 [Xenorhabdus szentirmaii DSM 16338]